MFDPSTLVRENIATLKPYTSARDISGKGGDKIYLDANENPYENRLGPGDRLNRYPPGQSAELLACLASFYGVNQDQILITRGSDEGIDLLIRSFCEPRQDAIVTCPPTFGFYQVSASIQGCETLEVPLDKKFGIKTEALIKAGQQKAAKIVFLCSPNNPTGNILNREAVQKTISNLSNTLVVVDEAYQEFSTESSITQELDNFPNLVILRTLSKAFGLAGIRCGVVISSPEIIKILRKVLPPYPVPIPVEEGALAAFSPAGLARLEYEIKSITEGREYLKKALEGLPVVEKIYPSETNFLLVRFQDAAVIKKRFTTRGIVVRDFSAVLPNTLRLSIGGREELDLLISALNCAFKPWRRERHSRSLRTTWETSIFTAVNLNKSTSPDIKTGIGFFDHMLEQLGKHGGFELALKAKGDLSVDAHHTVEDCAISLGQALKEALGSKRGIERYGFTLPMDEARAEVLVDLSGRGLLKFDGVFERAFLGDLPTEMIPHFFQSLAENMGATIHITVAGKNDHHKAEACFKALGRALKIAFQKSDSDLLPSTKGVL